MNHTTYHRYSNEELLSVVDNQRQKSDIIEELCQRIEAFPEECPHCKEDLRD